MRRPLNSYRATASRVRRLGRLAAGLLAVAGHAPSAPATAAEPPAPIVCIGAGVADLEQVSAAVDHFLRANWLREGENWFTALEIRPPPRNPFDLEAAKQPPLPTTSGFLWAHGLRCDVTETADGRPRSLVITASVFAFHESGAWSRPQQKGLLHLLRAERRGAAYQITLVPTEQSNLLPEATVRLPAAGEIPAVSRRLGLPCRGAASWDGRRCRAAAAPRVAR